MNSYDEMVSGLAVGNLNLYSAAHDGSGSAGSGKESYYKTNQLPDELPLIKKGKGKNTCYFRLN